MNYSQQRQFLKESQAWAALLSFVVIVQAAIYLSGIHFVGGSKFILFALPMAAVAVSLFYTPAYLHLSVNPEKPARWQYRIRWRVLGAALIIGMIAGSGLRERITVLVAIVPLLLVNTLAKYLPPRYTHVYYWITDLAVITALMFTGNLPILMAVALLCAAAHLSIVTCRQNCFIWAGIVFLSATAVLGYSTWRPELKLGFETLWGFATVFSLIGCAAFATAWMAYRAQRHNQRNVATAIRELTDFTGYSEEKIRHLWQTSNQQLAQNWERDKPSEKDPARMAEWYRQNSELYMFAISGYNLEFRRIISNLGVLKYARGATLDYGAGNGELLLDLAEHGHATMYYDVEGTSMAFAKNRAQQRGLKNLLFARTKDELADAARARGFDTVFSFDVLEHLADLAAELDFLASLLAPGGRMVFDVPAGSTKAHPMHLNHNLDVKAHLAAKGMQEERTLWQKLSPFKQEKFVFRRPA